jgi:hypothetical protein
MVLRWYGEGGGILFTADDHTAINTWKITRDTANQPGSRSLLTSDQVGNFVGHTDSVLDLLVLKSRLLPPHSS